VREVFLPGVTLDLQKRSYTVIARKLEVLLRELKPDVVHAGPLQGPAWLVARTGFQPLVTMSWGWDLLAEAERSRPMRWRTIYTLSKTAVLLADARAVAQKAISFRFSPERLRIFPWGWICSISIRESGQHCGGNWVGRKSSSFFACAVWSLNTGWM